MRTKEQEQGPRGTVRGMGVGRVLRGRHHPAVPLLEVREPRETREGLELPARELARAQQRECAQHLAAGPDARSG